MNTLFETIRYFVIITVELTLLFLGISTLIALLLSYISQASMDRWLNKKGLWGNVLGSLVGALTPFCACSTVPMALGMLNAGTPFGAVMSFVIASPLLNPIIITMLVALMGWKVALVYFLVTFVGSIVFGAALQKFGFADQVKRVRIKDGRTEAHKDGHKLSFKDTLRASFLSAWHDFVAVLGYLLIGVAVGAIIYGYIPQQFIVKIAGPDNFFSVPIAATIGVPLYIRAETAIPIGLGLLEKGMGIGTVIALIIGGSGMAIPEISMLAGIFKRKLVASLVICIWLTAVVGGYLFNVIA